MSHTEPRERAEGRARRRKMLPQELERRAASRLRDDIEEGTQSYEEYRRTQPTQSALRTCGRLSSKVTQELLAECIGMAALWN